MQTNDSSASNVVKVSQVTGVRVKSVKEHFILFFLQLVYANVKKIIWKTQLF